MLKYVWMVSLWPYGSDIFLSTYWRFHLLTHCYKEDNVPKWTEIDRHNFLRPQGNESPGNANGNHREIFGCFQEWDDINLAWNKSEYDDIVDIRLPPKYIWKQDLLMYNRWILKSQHQKVEGLIGRLGTYLASWKSRKYVGVSELVSCCYHYCIQF